MVWLAVMCCLISTTKAFGMDHRSRFQAVAATGEPHVPISSR